VRYIAQREREREGARWIRGNEWKEGRMKQVKSKINNKPILGK
jgi:hypothetical protein